MSCFFSTVLAEEDIHEIMLYIPRDPIDIQIWITKKNLSIYVLSLRYQEKVSNPQKALETFESNKEYNMIELKTKPFFLPSSQRWR